MLMNNKQLTPHLTHSKILIVDDETQIRHNLKLLLTKRFGLQVADAASGEEAISLIKQERFSLILLDYNMPGMSGRDVLIAIRAIDPMIQIIFLTARIEEALLIEMLQMGADDYVKKPYSQGELMARINTHLRINQLTQDLNRAVHTDDLTGLRNMRDVYRDIDRLLNFSEQKKESLAIVMLDLDHFKSVNDGHDHLFGSYVLQQVGKMMADHLEQNAKDAAFACRFGGDEFLWVMRGLGPEVAEKIVDDFRVLVANTLFQKNNDKIYITSSLGMAFCWHGQHLNSQSLLRVADWALYHSKEQGRNRLTTYDDNRHPALFEKAKNLGEVKRFTL